MNDMMVERMTADSFVDVLAGMFAEPQVVVKNYGAFYAIIVDEDFLSEEDHGWLKDMGFTKYPEFEESWVLTKNRLAEVIKVLKNLKREGFKKAICLSMSIDEYLRVKLEIEGRIPGDTGEPQEVEL